MKKILIIILIILILLLGGAWAYLLLNGAPESMGDVRDDLFGENIGENTNQFPQGDAGDRSPMPPAEQTYTESAGPIPTTALLTKITNRAVAGAVLMHGSTSPSVRYMEKGSGYIYDVDLQTGVETKLTNQTVQNVVRALWSQTGSRLIIETEVGGTHSATFLGTFAMGDGGSTLLETHSFGTVGNPRFSEDGTTLFYTALGSRGDLVAYAYDLRADTERALFVTPFTEAVVLWDIWDKKKHYVYPKPATGFQGYLYEVRNGALEKIDEALNLSALRTDPHTLVISKNSGDGPYSLLLNTEDGVGKFLDIDTLSQKCAGAGETLWCGASASTQSDDFPVSWYRGSVTYADTLWNIDRVTGESVMVTDPELVTREQIDVEDLQVGALNRIIFRNKRDDSLWLYNPPAR